MQLSDDVESGKVASVPFTKEMSEQLDELVSDMTDLDIEKKLGDDAT